MDLLQFAVLSQVIPPSPSGQATVLERLLRAIPADRYCLITNAEPPAAEATARRYYLQPESQINRPQRPYRARVPANYWWRVLQRAKRLRRIIRDEKCEALIACSGDLLNIPAGYLASRWAKVPFYAYLFDDYLYQWTLPLDRAFAKRAERMSLKGAAKIIVPNEFAREEYRRRYGVEASLIHNPYATGDDVSPRTLNSDEIRIVYTGAIYHANAAALRNLVQAIERVGDPRIKLHIYTSQSPEILEYQNLRGPIVIHDHVQPDEAQRIQSDADVLFLPLAFDSEIPEVIRTSAPGKMGEYLASGRPVLAHVPADSFVSWYLRRHECGFVVDRDDVAVLAQAIQNIINDDELRTITVQKAQVRARADFSLEVAQRTFLNLLSREAA